MNYKPLNKNKIEVFRLSHEVVTRMPTIKKHNNRRAVRQRTAEGANHWVQQQGSKCTNQSC